MKTTRVEVSRLQQKSSSRIAWTIWASILACIALLTPVSAYQVLISEQDLLRQSCTGMWGSGGSREPYIEVLFSSASRGQLALVIYEWKDAKYLGIDSDGTGAGANNWEDERVYVCNLAASQANLCTTDQLGQFIVDMPSGQSINDTTIWTTAVRFDSRASADLNSAASAALDINRGPFRYQVKKTGYYCVGAVPVTISTGATPSSDDLDEGSNNSTSTVRTRTAYTGVVDFQNTFKGHLPASEYPKIWFYGALACAYAVIGAVWAFLCYKHRRDILSIQHYVSATILFIMVEMIALSGYYRYLNNSGTASFAKAYLGFVAILNAGRNSISFFMLLIVCMGYGVVRPSLGSVMLRAQILAVVHFIFGVMYSIGIVTIPLESAGIFLFFCVFPLAFTLTAFMMWIMWSLNATIRDLEARKQSFKKSMFTRVYRILMGAVVVIIAFFVITSYSFSSRFEEDFAADTWQNRWLLLDGWLGILYLACFCAIAYTWRPSENNRRLAMSDELATDEADADEFEIDTLRDNRLEDEEHADGKDGPPRGYNGVGNDEVVFDIGEEADSEEEGDVGRNGPPSGSSSKNKKDAGTREENERLRYSMDQENDRQSSPPGYDSVSRRRD